jgi:sec-independent protein translocase protein TatA
MGLGGISIWQLLIILVIVVLIFGTKRLKSLGGDLGGALKSFRKAMDQDEDKTKSSKTDEQRRIENGGEADAEFAEEHEKEAAGKERHG